MLYLRCLQVETLFERICKKRKEVIVCMRKRQLDLTGHRIWEDKNIKPECKRIYSYLYSIGYDKIDFLVNIGDIQPIIQIKNVGFRNNLKLLEDNDYLIFYEYANGMYDISIC